MRGVVSFYRDKAMVDRIGRSSLIAVVLIEPSGKMLHSCCLENEDGGRNGEMIEKRKSQCESM